MKEPIAITWLSNTLFAVDNILQSKPMVQNFDWKQCYSDGILLY